MASKDEEPIVVTDENFADLLIEGLKEAVAVSRSEQEPARTRSRPIPVDRDGPRP